VKSLLAKNAEVLVTMDDKRRELKNAGLYAVDGVIKQVGPTEELPKTADVVVNLSGQIALPGLVNTHHHLNQPWCETYLQHRAITCSHGFGPITVSGPARRRKPHASAPSLG
jgi:cytosine/adenosine deaminase-related metal-dependent hydrolase